VGHEPVLGGFVPVPFAERGVDGLAGCTATAGPQRAWTSAMPSVTRRVWPRAWMCQAVRDPGAKQYGWDRSRRPPDLDRTRSPGPQPGQDRRPALTA
jgi:hypothetical protein